MVKFTPGFIEIKNAHKCPRCDRLAAQLEEARERETELLKIGCRRIEALQNLLGCYRMERQPTEKLFTELGVTERKWEEALSRNKQEGGNVSG